MESLAIVLSMFTFFGFVGCLIFLISFFCIKDSNKKRDKALLIASFISLIIGTVCLIVVNTKHPWYHVNNQQTCLELIEDYNYDRTKAWANTLTESDYEDMNKIKFISEFNSKVDTWNKNPDDRPDGLKDKTLEPIKYISK
jgi:ABC-type long-subunit fatty acid transport system fused permease/ATPase subunit